MASRIYVEAYGLPYEVGLAVREKSVDDKQPRSRTVARILQAFLPAATRVKFNTAWLSDPEVCAQVQANIEETLRKIQRQVKDMRDTDTGAPVVSTAARTRKPLSERHTKITKGR